MTATAHCRATGGLHADVTADDRWTTGGHRRMTGGRPADLRRGVLCGLDHANHTPHGGTKKQSSDLEKKGCWHAMTAQRYVFGGARGDPTISG